MKTLTPGEIAQYCDVHQRTVSRWIASGQLKGFKLPGRGNYRVVLADFIEFLQKQRMPVPPEFSQATSVLVVDDEVAYQRAILRVLKSSGYEVFLAADGFQAGIMLLEEKPSVMTLDLQMPGLDGFEVLKFIRQRPELHHIKILVISGLGLDELEKARAAGADATLAKPFDNALLLNAIAQLLH